MTEKVSLSAEKREIFGRKTKSGRKSGRIPCVLYGRGVETQSLWVNELQFGKLIRQSGESVLIELEIGKEDKRNVILYDFQNDPVSGRYIHLDFFQVRMDEAIETEVELVYVGESPAVKESGGVLVKNMDSVEVKCLPADLPSEIKVDISSLKTFDDYIYVKDLPVSKKVEISLDGETVVALVSPPRSQEELEQLETKVEADVTQVEGVVKEEKTAEGEASKEGEKDKK